MFANASPIRLPIFLALLSVLSHGAPTPPSIVRLMIDGTSAGVELTQTRLIGPGKVFPMAWLKERALQGAITEQPIPANTWTRVGLSFIPSRDGRLTVILGGHDYRVEGKPVPVTTFWDDLTVTGSVLENGDFEKAWSGEPLAWWKTGTNEPVARLVQSPDAVHSGRQAIRTWMNSGYAQRIPVKEGVPVEVKVWAYVAGQADLPAPSIAPQPSTQGAVPDEYRILGTTDRKIAIYKAGETMVFNLKVLRGDTAVAGNLLEWTRTGEDGLTLTGKGIADEKGLSVTTSLGKPGFVRLRVKAFGPDGKSLTGAVGANGKKGEIFFEGGACVAPESLQPIPEPSDFDAFWSRARENLAKVPMSVKLVEIPNPALTSKRTNLLLYQVEISCAGPKPVTGYLTVPKGAKEKSLPAKVVFYWHGVYKQPVPWGDDGVICLEINAHGQEMGREDAYYGKLKEELGDYGGNRELNGDREKTYWYGMALRALRALDYLKSRPEWDRTNLKATGGSQGGLQALWAAGLDPQVTACDVWAPYCCDMGGRTVGRTRGGSPEFTEALRYYDPVYHAKRIKAATRLVANLGDDICPPGGVWIAWNQVPHGNKTLEVRQGSTHGFDMKGGARFTVTPSGIQEIPEAP